MAIYIGTKRIDGGGNQDPSIVKLATNYDASIQMYSIPVFCSSTNSNLISPMADEDNTEISLRIIPTEWNAFSISNCHHTRPLNSDNITNVLYPGIEFYPDSGVSLISSETGHIGDGWFSVTPDWDIKRISCKAWDGYKNDASSSKSSWYYQDTHTGYIYPTVYTSYNTYSMSGYYLLLYPNTILDLTNADFSTSSGYINVTYGEAGVSNIIVRENAKFSGIIVAGGDPEYKILYGPNFEENAVKGLTGDPSTIVCYSFLTMPDSKLLLVNAAQYKEA